MTFPAQTSSDPAAQSGARSRIVVAGGSGLIGTALTKRLERRGDTVLRLVRRPSHSPGEMTWNPAAGELDPAAVEGVDAFVNLAGAGIADGRWTAARRAAIRDSRIHATRTLVTAIGGMRRKPGVLINASAVGYYGDGGDAVLTETGAAGRGFLAEVCQAWEAEAMAAEHAGVRVVRARLGVVLAGEGGALRKMLPVFRLGAGGRIGDGRQWMSWIALDDAVGALLHALDDGRLSGAVNVTAPTPVTNREFTATLARALRRPAWLPVPAVALRLLFGEMADATLLASTRVLPARLAATGYGFVQPTLATALARAVTVGH